MVSINNRRRVLPLVARIVLATGIGGIAGWNTGKLLKSDYQGPDNYSTAMVQYGREIGYRTTGGVVGIVATPILLEGLYWIIRRKS